MTDSFCKLLVYLFCSVIVIHIVAVSTDDGRSVSYFSRARYQRCHSTGDSKIAKSCYDLSVLSMSVMGFQKKVCIVGGWVAVLLHLCPAAGYHA